MASLTPTASFPVFDVAVLAGADPMDGRDAEKVAANVAMERYARGDDAAFGAVYDALAPRLHRYLARQVRDDARADDLLQQTLLHVHRARGRFLPGADVFPWAFAIARRLLIDHVRRGKYEVLLADEDRREPVDAYGADELLHSKRLAEAVERELERMPGQHREAFELVKQEGLSLKDAAAVLGTTVTAVKLRAHRAYVGLRAALRGDDSN